MQPDLEIYAAELLQGLVEVDLPPVDLGARLLLHGIGDVDRGHRPEQPTFGAGPRLDRDRAPLELGRQRLRGLTLTSVAYFAVPPHRVGLLLTAGGCLQRQAARHEVVARVAVGDVHDVALVAEIFDIGADDDLHSSPSSSAAVTSASSSSTPASSSASPLAALGCSGSGRISRSSRSPRSRSRRPFERCVTCRTLYGSSAISRATRIARATATCCCWLLPVTRRARIFARSDMNRRRRFTSL